MSRARGKRACCASSPQRARAVAALLCTCASRLLIGSHASTSEHGLAPKERGLSLVQRPSIGHEPTTTSAARRARAASTRVVPPPEREQVQWRNRVCAHAHAGCVGGRGRRIAPLSCTEGERPHAGAVSFHRTWIEYNQPGAACAGRKRTCCASSRERASAAARSRVCTRASLLCERPQLARRSAALHQ